MKFPTLFLLFSALTLSLILSLSSATSLTPAAKPLRLINRCRPMTIQRDALCACYTCGVFGLADRSFTRRCARLFRVDRLAMRRSCNFYMVRTPRGSRFRSRALFASLRFISNRCPTALNRAGIKVDLDASARILSNFQVRQRIDDVLSIIRDMLAHIQPMPAVTTPPERMVVVGEQDRKRVARLREYNDIQE